MDPYADDWTLDGLKKLMGAIYPEAVRQAREEVRQRLFREIAQQDCYEWLGWDRGADGGDAATGVVRVQPDGDSLSWEAPSPLPSWRSRTPAEVAEYDRRFCHLLGIAWDADLSGAPRS